MRGERSFFGVGGAPPAQEFRQRSALEILQDAEREQQDFGLRVYTDYKELCLPELISRMAHLTPEQAERQPLRVVATPEQLKGFRLLQDLTLTQVRQVQRMKVQAFLESAKNNSVY